jgi:hypothetical protein
VLEYGALRVVNPNINRVKGVAQMPNKKSGGDEDGGGVNISGNHVNVGGNVAGRDQHITTTNTTTHGISGNDLAKLLEQFQHINKQIEAQPEDPNVDKAEVKETVEKIQEEVKKGEEANPTKVERWLMNLGAMSDDIFQVTAATLTNPVLGVAKAIQLIAAKAKEEKAKQDAKS